MPYRTTRFLTLPLMALLACGVAAAAQPASVLGVEVCTVAGTSGQYSVRVRNISNVTLSHADVVGVHLDAAGKDAGKVNVSLTDVPPGKYKTAVLAQHGESAALVSIATYQTIDDVDTPQQELYAGKVAHVAHGSSMQYTLAPLALRGWTVAYGTAQGPKLEPGSAVLLVYPARTGKKRDITRPDAGRTPADVVPLDACPARRR